jgi:hypothetical protein
VANGMQPLSISYSMEVQNDDTDPTSCDNAWNFFGILCRRKCLSLLLHTLTIDSVVLLLAQYILFVIGHIGQLCHAIETRFSPMLAIERTRQCGISDHRANAVIFALGKRSTFS